MKAPTNRPKADPIAQGTYSATCYAVIDLGTHIKKSQKYGNKEERQLRIMWEIPTLRITYEKDGVEVEAPKAMGKTYKFSTYKKAKLSEHLTSWGYTDLDNLDFKTLIGKSCMLNVAHFDTDDGIVAYVNAVMSLPVGTADTPLENPCTAYSIDEDGDKIPDGVTDHWRGQIKESPEYKRLSDPDAPPIVDTTDYSPDATDDIPF